MLTMQLSAGSGHGPFMYDGFVNHCLFACKEKVLWVSVRVTAPSCVVLSSAGFALLDSVFPCTVTST